MDSSLIDAQYTLYLTEAHHWDEVATGLWKKLEEDLTNVQLFSDYRQARASEFQNLLKLNGAARRIKDQTDANPTPSTSAATPLASTSSAGASTSSAGASTGLGAWQSIPLVKPSKLTGAAKRKAPGPGPCYRVKGNRIKLHVSVQKEVKAETSKFEPEVYTMNEDED